MNGCIDNASPARPRPAEADASPVPPELSSSILLPLVFSLVLSLPAVVWSSPADAAPADEPEDNQQASPRVPTDGQATDQPSTDDEGVDPLAVATAAVPGLIVHGAGHFVAGDADTGWKLVWAELASAGLLVGGFSGLAVTGAAHETITPLIAMTAAGGTGFFFSWLADVYGVSTGSAGLGEPVTRPGRLDVSVGYQYVENPTFAFGHFAHAGAKARLSNLHLGADGWFGVGADNWRAEARLGWRFLGPRPARSAAPRGADGSFVDAEAGLNVHAYGDDGFLETTPEAQVRGRLDLHHYAQALRGSFVEGAFGVGWTHYSHDGHPDDWWSLLLFDASFGMYLGRGQDGFGELAVFYDHRHDGFAGGAKLSGMGSGPAGSAGVRLLQSATGPWGFEASFEAGSAYIGRLDLVYRPGGRR